MQLTSSDTAQHEPEEVLPSILPVYVLTASFIVDDILMVSLFQCNHGLFYLSRLQCSTLNCLNCLIIITNFTSKQYPLPAVSRLASGDEQWLHIFYIYSNS